MLSILLSPKNLGLKKTIISGGVWRIRRRERSPVIEVFKIEETGHGDILTSSFVEWRTKKQGQKSATVPAVGKDFGSATIS